jgi:peptide/nickel transport system permease protein
MTGPSTDYTSSDRGVEEIDLVPDGILTDTRDLIVPMWKQRLRIFTHNKLAVASVVFLVLMTVACYLVPWLHPTNQTNQALTFGSKWNSAPSRFHWLGTDSSGFDELGRIFYGGEYSLTLGFLAGFITIVVGTLYGMISGFVGGLTDTLMMRLLDAFLSIPYIFLLLTLITIFNRSTLFLICVIGFTGWWGNARIIRGDALLIRNLEYSQAATAMGASKLHIIRRHVFPNSISNIVTVATFSVADAILFLSALGFLGLGIQAPQTDWGTMLQAGSAQFQNGYWWEVFPLATVFILVVVSINYIGDALRDAFEVRLLER